MQPLYRTGFLLWNLLLAGIVIYVAVSTGWESNFVGGTWGWEVPLVLLAFPFGLVAVSAVAWIYLDSKLPGEAPRGWSDLRWRTLAIALLLTPLIALIFQMGEGYDWSAKVATGTAILQWLMFIHSLENSR